MAIRMQQRRGTSTQWTNANPVLGEGEIGWESNTNKFKIGDGVNEWADLPYFLDEDTLEGAVDDFIPLTQKGVANGVATLNASAKIPSEQLDIDELSQDAVNNALTAGTGITKTYNDNANTITVAVDTSTIAPLSGPTFTGTVTLPGTTSIGDVSATEIGYLNNVSSSIQTQLDAKLSLAGGTMTGALTLAGAPNNALDAATKAYVDAVSEGLHIHQSCVAATTANVDISTDLEPGDVVDGVTLAEGNRVLVKAQTNAAQNGIYVVQASGAALRASDFNEPQEVDGGDFVFVTGGTLGDNTGWVQTTTNVVTIGTDPITFTQFSGAGTYQAGTGLTLTDNVFSVNQSVIAPLAGPTFTGTVSLPSTTSIGDVSATEIGYLNNVSSAIQTQLDGKAASNHTHAIADVTNLQTILNEKASITGTETLTNKSLTSPNLLAQVKEEILTSGTGFAGYTFNVMDDAVHFITANATNNGTLNFRGNASTTLNTFMAVNQSITCVLLITNGATPYRPNAFQIDGASITPRWQGGTAPTAGNANSIDAYTFTILKTANATYTVLASQTRFA